MKYGLSKQQLAEITAIIATYPEVEVAILYGSRAMGNHKKGSDVDIALKGEKVDWSLANRVKSDLEENTWQPFFFDVVAYGGIESDEMRTHIDGVGEVIYRGGVWKKHSLATVIEIIGGGTPKTANQDYWEGDIPWISVGDFTTGRKFVSHTKKMITQKGLQNSSTNLLDKGDIVISTRGTVGAIAVLSRPMTFNQTSYGVRGVAGKSYSDFIYYLLKSKVPELQKLSYGGIFDTITRNTFAEIDVSLPPLKEQKSIAAILSSLDDKIDLLHRQNKTLESLAETLFRQWFVEDAGEWEECSLSEIADFLNGLACQKLPPENETEKLPVLKIKELSSGISATSDWATSKVEPKYIVESGDVIFSWSASLMVKLWDGEKCALNQHLFKVTSTKYPKWLYFMWCKHYLDQFIAISQAKATTMGHIKRGDLDAAMVLIPPPDELKAMTQTMHPLLEKHIFNSKQMKQIQMLRDGLLPKLVSGEVNVSGVR